MTPSELAQYLIDADRGAREALLRENAGLAPAAIAESLQQSCYEAWTENPQQVARIADTLQSLTEFTKNTEVRGYAEWAEAIREIVDGDFVRSIECIDRSEFTFSSINKDHLAAKTQTSKLYDLAMLGRYEEAVDCGKRALAIFLEHDDLYSAGKIEHNIGNLYWRRDMYRESEPYLESACARFIKIEDQRQIAMVENCQAFVKTLQNQFREAELLYRRALDRTVANGLLVTEAEIGIGLSNLYLYESKYDLALKFMERSRQHYEHLEMPNQSAMCELEIADIYLDLNLVPEAVEFYEQAAIRLDELGMQAELARCCLGQARALIRQNQRDKANALLDRAEQLYTLEGNAVAIGSARLARAQLLFAEANLREAKAQADMALSAFKESDNLRLLLFARWLMAEIAHASGKTREAIAEFEATLERAQEQCREVEYLCLVSLGKITGSERHLEAAIELVEISRGTLSAVELRTSYFADRIVPYNELIKINFAKGRFEDAFRLHERSRARTLADGLQETAETDPSDERLDRVREELNWYHQRINKSRLDEFDDRRRIAALRKLAFEREKEYSELRRRASANGAPSNHRTAEIDIDAAKCKLDDATFVEFVSIEGRISAFVLSKNTFTALPNFVDEANVNEEVKQLLFQIKTGRFIDQLSDENRSAALARLRSHSTRIYNILLKPLTDLIHTDRVVFAPSGLLHYLPFHALHTGSEYLTESYQISYAPSLFMLTHCLDRRSAKHRRALIVGVGDAAAPLVETEVKNVADLFLGAAVLLGPSATVVNIKEKVIGKDVVHFACHGKFRPDNPDFSSLSLYSEELTVTETRNLRLDNCLLVLSACETGLNEVVRGEELVGLTRAFFGAGASTLVLSLWRANDETTLSLMTDFYTGFCGGERPAKALQLAQRRMIVDNVHPYFWAPFMVSGRW
jgi:CHAT domain-containing protein